MRLRVPVHRKHQFHGNMRRHLALKDDEPWLEASVALAGSHWPWLLLGVNTDRHGHGQKKRQGNEHADHFITFDRTPNDRVFYKCRLRFKVS